MQNTIPCPSCNRELRVPDQLLGKLVKCPACSKTFTADLSPPVSTPADQASSDPYQIDRQSEPLEDIPIPSSEVVDDDDYEPRPMRKKRRRFYVEHRGAMVLTLGILSLVICGFLGPVAWTMGNNDLSAMRSGRMDPSGEGLTQAGRILGIISSVMLILSCVLACMWMAAVGFMGAAGGGRKF
jgi:hypothetical protein